MNKVALVTGGTRGIGKEITTKLAENGYIIILNYYPNDDKANKALNTIKKISPDSILKKADVSDFKAVNQMIEEIIKNFGRIDVLINNAGIVKDSTLKNMRYDQWDEVIKTNLYGVFNCTRAVIKYMIKQNYGKIVSIASVVASSGNFGQTNYVASKAGIIGFTKSLSLEVAKYNINVNCVSPGFTDTDMIKSIPKKYLDTLLSKIPLKRFAKPQEIASLVLYLVSEEANYITGQNIGINGGYYM